MGERVVADDRRRRRRPTRSGVILSEQLIVETALRMVEEHGSEGMSVRRLGRALGADPSSIYRYFRSIDDLRLAMADELITRVTSEWTRSGEWKKDLYSWGISAHTEYLKYPKAAQMAAARITGRPAELVGVELILGTLRGAGFPDDLAVLCYRLFVTQMLSYAAWDGAARVLENRADDVDRWKSVYACASAEDFENIAAVAPLLEKTDGSSAYPMALRFLIGAMNSMKLNSREPDGKE